MKGMTRQERREHLLVKHTARSSRRLEKERERQEKEREKEERAMAWTRGLIRMGGEGMVGGEGLFGGDGQEVRAREFSVEEFMRLLRGVYIRGLGGKGERGMRRQRTEAGRGAGSGYPRVLEEVEFDGGWVRLFEF